MTTMWALIFLAILFVSAVVAVWLNRWDWDDE